MRRIEVEGKIARVEETIQARIAPHEEVLNRLNTIPGINRLTASTLIAELGVEMQQFPDAMHLASWAGLCPGDCESAGKRKNTRTRKGNPHVRRVLCQAAWAAAHTKHSYPAALFYRIASRAGRNKALPTDVRVQGAVPDIGHRRTRQQVRLGPVGSVVV